VSIAVSRAWLRRGALGGVGLVVAAYGSVLYEVADVVGEATALLALVTGALVAATLMARLLSPRVALLVTVGLLGAGLAAYLGAVPEAARAAVTPTKLLDDTVTMLSGLSVLRLLAAGTWALTVAPGPTFLAWYLGVRGRYAGAVAVAGVTLGLFVLTGDAGELVTLTGAVGGAVALGLGNLERATAGAGGAPDRSGGAGGGENAVLGPGAVAQLESLTAVVAAMVLLSASVGLAAGGVGGGGEEGGISLGGSGGAAQANLVSGSDEIEVAGSLSLSPRVRMVVESTERSYWRTATYDRYTGEGWVRTREATPYEGPLSGPPGQTEPIRQTVTARTALGVMPAANAPVAVEGAFTNRTLVTPQGALKPVDGVAANESYTVRSERPVATADGLRAAGTDYPATLDGTYRQLPSSTPDRVYRRAEEVAGGESTAYDKAVAVENYLEANKEYSLTVQQPSGDVADTFLFEMDAGYCTYFATTMVTMLRAQDVPARLATGYTPGQAVGESGGETTYVVRGMNAHVWAEVYFPEVGWVRFDPTPAGPRQAAEDETLREARSGDLPDIEARNSEQSGPTPTPTPTGNATTTANNGSITTPELPNGTAGPAGGAGGGPIPGLPSERVLGLGLVALIGAAAVTRRSGLAGRVRRTAGRYYQRPSGDAATDASRAWRRVEDAFGRRHRPRRPGETPRAYLDALDAAGAAVGPRARELVRLHERARYGDGVSEAEATGARQRADALTRREVPVVGRYYRRQT
jgi:transglutaminase-like putative cysteine protease